MERIIMECFEQLNITVYVAEVNKFLTIQKFDPRRKP